MAESVCSARRFFVALSIGIRVDENTLKFNAFSFTAQILHLIRQPREIRITAIENTKNLLRENIVVPITQFRLCISRGQRHAFVVQALACQEAA